MTIYTRPVLAVLRSPTSFLVAAAVAVSMCVVPAAAIAAPSGDVVGTGPAEKVKDSYIVVVKDSAAPRAASARTAQNLTARYGGQVRKTWQHALNGFAVQMNAEQ